MAIYSKRKHSDIKIQELLHNREIEEVTDAKLLGISFDSFLKWEPHISYISKIISGRLYLLKRTRDYLPIEARKRYNNALIQPHLTYCSSIWGNCSNELLNDILKLQKRAARIILGASYHTPSVNHFRPLKWLPIYNIISGATLFNLLPNIIHIMSLNTN